MKKRVNITTLGWFLDMLFPCYCKGCGKIGSAFCQCCIFNNLEENPPFFTVLDPNFSTIFVCGMRVSMLSRLIIDYKFHARRYLSRVFADYMFYAISRECPKLLEEKAVLVPLPTISKHIRERGFDHILRLCKDFSAISDFTVLPALSRANSAVQVGASEEKRLEQAKGAYIINSKVNLDIKSHYILVDDVWTTGASMRAARDVLGAELLRLGAKKSEIKISAILLAKNSGGEFS